MKIRFRGRLIRENTDWEMICNATKDDYSVSQRNISVVVGLNGQYNASLKEYFSVDVIEEEEEEKT